MDDLISRSAVLSLPRNTTRNFFGEIVEETINVADIEKLPSAVTIMSAVDKLTIQNGNDNINRQEVIETIFNEPLYEPGMKERTAIAVVLAIYEKIKLLPSARSKNKAAERLNDLIFDINPAEICSQIESDNLKNWCSTIQTEMKMAMVQLPCWAEREEENEVDRCGCITT